MSIYTTKESKSIHESMYEYIDSVNEDTINHNPVHVVLLKLL